MAAGRQRRGRDTVVNGGVEFALEFDDGLGGLDNRFGLSGAIRDFLEISEEFLNQMIVFRQVGVNPFLQSHPHHGGCCCSRTRRGKKGGT